jgi:hypothetical protein
MLDQVVHPQFTRPDPADRQETISTACAFKVSASMGTM